MRSSALKRNGPLPTISVTALFGSVVANRSGMMQGMLVPVLPSAFGSSGNGFFSRNRTTLSETADSSSVTAISALPNASRAAKRRMLGTTSCARTGSPSWNRSPSRKVRSQVLPSFSTACPASICGWIEKSAAWPYSVSNTR